MKYYVEELVLFPDHNRIPVAKLESVFRTRSNDVIHSGCIEEANTPQEALRKKLTRYGLTDDEIFITTTTSNNYNCAVALVSQENFHINYYKVSLRSNLPVYFRIDIYPDSHGELTAMYPQRYKYGHFSLEREQKKLEEEVEKYAYPPDQGVCIFQTSFSDYLYVLQVQHQSEKLYDFLMNTGRCKCLCNVQNQTCIFGLLTFNSIKGKIVRFQLLADVDATIEDLNEQFTNNVITDKRYYLVILNKLGVPKLKHMLEESKRDEDFIDYLYITNIEGVYIDFCWSSNPEKYQNYEV